MRTIKIVFICLIGIFFSHLSWAAAKQVYIDDADNERIIENYNAAMALLNTYYHLFGADKAYLMTKARLYADAGYYNSALRINTPLIQHYPEDSYIMATQASALFQSGRRKEGLFEFNKLIQKYPSSDDIDYMSVLIKEPLQTSISLGGRFSDLSQSGLPADIPTSEEYIHQNDSVNIVRIPLLLQVPINPNTALIFKYQYEILSADSGSDLATITNHSRIEDSEFYLGFDSFLLPCFDLGVLAGDLAITNGKNFMVYSIGASVMPDEKYKIILQALRELFRPIDLSNGSPRSVSLGVLETGGRGHVSIKTTLESTIDLDFRGSSLSDNNSYFRLAFEPGFVIYNTEKTTFELGLNTEWLSFRKNLSNTDGYYSPRFYQNYELVGLWEVRAASNFLLQMFAGAGITKDENSHFGPSTDVGIEGEYNPLKNIDCVAEVDYSTRAIQPFYSEVIVSLGVTWRFA